MLTEAQKGLQEQAPAREVDAGTWEERAAPEEDLAWDHNSEEGCNWLE